MVIPEKPQAARSEISSWFFKCKHTSALILRTWQTAIFTSKAPALVVCCPVWGHPRGCCPATSGTSCGRNLGVIDRILNEWCDPFVSAARLNEWFTTNFGCGRADCGLSFSPATRCGLRGRGPHSNRYRTGKGHRKAAAAKWGIFSRRRRRRATHPAQLREIARARVIV